MKRDAVPRGVALGVLTVRMCAYGYGFTPTLLGKTKPSDKCFPAQDAAALLRSKQSVRRALECARLLLDAGTLATTQALAAWRQNRRKRNQEDKRRKEKLKEQKYVST